MGVGNSLQPWKWQYQALEVVRKTEIWNFFQFPSLNLSQMPKYGVPWTLCGAFQYAQVFLNVCCCFESH